MIVTTCGPNKHEHTVGRNEMNFEEIVESQFIEPLQALLKLFGDEDTSSQEQMLGAIFELSRCAFLGFEYTAEANARINQLLDYWIDVSHTMSSTSDPH
jgi:hypothetical protein